MLPDYPELKRELLQRLKLRVQTAAVDEPVLRDLKAFRIHEGRCTVLTREDGSTQEMNFTSPVSGEATLRIDDIRLKGEGASLKAADDIALGLQESMATRFFETISKSVDDVGNSFDAKGKPMTADMILEMLDRMELSFDDEGNWQPPRIIHGPALAATAAEVQKQLGVDRTLRARQDAIVNRQREEWRVREARRKLVD